MFKFIKEVFATAIDFWSSDSNLLSQTTVSEPESFLEPKPEPKSEPLVVPTPSIPEMSEEEELKIREYKKIAKDIQFLPFNLQYLELFVVLSKARIPVYDFKEVREYLRKIGNFARSGQGVFGGMVSDSWIWAPMRLIDMEPEPEKSEVVVTTPWIQAQAQAPQKIRYEHIIPISVLSLVNVIHSFFPESRFFVSETDGSDEHFMYVTFETNKDRRKKEKNVVVFAYWNGFGFGL